MQLDKTTILIVNDIQQTIEDIKQQLPLHSVRIIQNEDEDKSDFLISHARMAVKEAYIAVNTTKYILLCANYFQEQAQNALLKVLEEPPLNIVFILITTSRTSILPTILSRVSIQFFKTKQPLKTIDLNIKTLTLNDIYNFIKQYERINKTDLKELIQAILYKVKLDNKTLTSEQLNSFSDAIKLCELNSRPVNILTTLLINLLE